LTTAKLYSKKKHPNANSLPIHLYLRASTDAYYSYTPHPRKKIFDFLKEDYQEDQYEIKVIIRKANIPLNEEQESYTYSYEHIISLV
jgi:hypothetical protein